MTDSWRPLAYGYDPQDAPDPIDPDDYVQGGWGLLCLPCDDGECHTCYGGPCECDCEGEEV